MLSLEDPITVAEQSPPPLDTAKEQVFSVFIETQLANVAAAVQEGDGVVVGGAEPHEQAAARAQVVIEIALIPDGALVQHVLGFLRVPVAGDL